MIRFGSLELKSNLYLSPLAGYTNLPFRLVAREIGGLDLATTDLVNARSLIEENPKAFKLIETNENDRPLAVQLFGSVPEEMRDAAVMLQERGVSAIDINMGCPVRKIARKGGGSGLIREPELAARIVESVAAAVAIPVTVKTRLGWCGGVDSRGVDSRGVDSRGDDSSCGDSSGSDSSGACELDHDNKSRVTTAAVAWCRQLESAGARLLTLHGRTREQGFSGRCDWAAIAAVKRSLTIPLIANGDVNSPEAARRCLQQTGADGVMVGRGTLGAPWLVGQIAAALEGRPLPPTPGPAERLALAAEQLQALLASRGERGLLIARKHMGWTCQGFAGAPQLRHALMRAATPAAALELLNRAAAALP